MGDDGGDSGTYGDPYGALGKDWFDIANRAPTLLTPEDWYNWGKGQPGFFGTYQDPQSGQTRPTPAPPSLVPSGVYQNYDPASGKWNVHDDRTGGFFGFVENDPYLFAALAAAAFAGGVALAPGAAAAGAGAGVGETGAATGAALAPELEGGTFGALPASTFSTGEGLFGTGITGQQALQGASLLNSARNLAQNPGGASAGGFLGSVASAYTGIPGLGTAGSFAGGAGEEALGGSTGGDTLQDSGGRGMAESTGGTDTGGTGTMDWINTLGPLLTSGVGLTGSALSLAAMPEVLKRLETLYNQSQGNFQQQTQYAQMYQALLQHYQQQQQQAFQEQTGQTATDRANAATANEGRAGVAGRLSDPAQVAAGAQQLYQPMSQGMTDNLLRGVQRDLAMRGQSDGGAASRATADAMAPYYNQLQQQAMQHFLSSQGQALSAYNPLRGPYSPDPPQPPFPAQLPKPDQYVPGASGGPQADQSGAYKGLSDQVAQLGKLLFGGAATSPGAVGLLSKLFGGGGGGQNPDVGTSTDALGQQYNTDFIKSFGGGDTGGGPPAAAYAYDYGLE